MKDKVQPDRVTQELKRGFEWTTTHSNLVIVVVAVLFVAGGAGAAYSFISDRKETSLQEKYFQVENEYETKKQQFELSAASSNQPADPKTKKAPVPQGLKASGDLEQDYGSVVKGLREITAEAPSSRGAALSALLLAEVYRSYQKPAEAIEALKTSTGARGVMGAFVKSELGSQMADQKDCEGALKVWSDLTKDKSAKFMVPQLKLKMALCSESLGKKTEAQDYYKQVVAEGKDTTAGRSAEKLLRLLQAQSATN
ncbi:MAG: tetratricopeptide repeat protein [Bdellovibrio sp.]|jgi:hypothetical protein